MTSPRLRGIVAVRAMARPQRAPALEAAVVAAMGACAPGLSIRSQAQHVARLVVREILAADRRTDPMEIALAALARTVEAVPVAMIAEELEGELVEQRCARFRARGARQMSPRDWESETAEIAAMLEKRFAARFRAILAKK